MTNINRTVVGIDGSRTSVDALNWALADAALRGDQLDIVHAWTPEILTTIEAMPIMQDEADAEAAAKELLETTADAALANAATRPAIVRTHLVHGHASQVLIEESRVARQVVVGADGLGALRRMVVGSTTDAILHEVQSTFTVVPHQDMPGDGRVVVGVDDWENSFAALTWAYKAAARHNTPLVAVHAVPSTFDYVGANGRAAATGNPCLAIEDMINKIGTQDGEPRSMAVLSTFGSPAQLLLDEAQGASLLVVGSDPDNHVGRMFGRTARKCVHHAPCPTTVVKVRP